MRSSFHLGASIVFYYSISFLLSSQNAGVEASSAMRRLFEDLFSDYNRLILPVGANQTKVAVSVGLKLGQILDLNLKQQILSTNVVVEQSWHDDSLKWDPKNYEGIELIHVPAENIWIPDIVLFNNADGNYELTLVAKAHAYYNGTVFWKPPTMFRSTCEIDVEFFPFDIQTCYLRFGSWTHAGDEVDLKLIGSTGKGSTKKLENGIDLSQFYKNVEWDIIDGPAYLNEVYRDCCPEPYQDITFKIVIRRKILFYLVNLILPVALMTFMTISVFYLPSDSNEKITLSISVITSLIVFFLLMLEIIPASSLAVSLFGKYLLFTLVLVSLSACVSVYVLNIHHRLPAIHSVSPRMRQIFLKTLPRLLFLNQPDPRERSSLNRFRQKKIAQKILSQHNKVYDLSEPMAASLNLIETLHKSYQIDPSEDTLDPKKQAQLEEEDEGRYFRRYVDDYIDRLNSQVNVKKEAGNCASCNCGASSRFVPQNTGLVGRMSSQGSRPNSSLGESGQVRGGKQVSTSSWKGATSWAPEACSSSKTNLTKTMESSDLAQHHRQTSAFTGLLNDDTLDMTFDYDDQLGDPHLSRLSASRCSNLNPLTMRKLNKSVTGPCDNLPSPPPPPRESSHFSTGRLSSCSKNLSMPDSSDESVQLGYDSNCKSVLLNQGYVDKLITNIQMINNGAGDIDATTTSSSALSQLVHDEQNVNRDPAYQDDIVFLPAQPQTMNVDHSQDRDQVFAQRQQQQRQQQAPNRKTPVACPCMVAQSGLRTANEGQKPEVELKRPSELLLSLRLPYDQMPAHIRSAIRNVLFIADTIKNEDDENSAIEDWESISMVIDRLNLWIFFFLCTLGSFIILASAPSLYDTRIPIDERLSSEILPSSCNALNGSKY